MVRGASVVASVAAFGTSPLALDPSLLVPPGNRAGIDLLRRERKSLSDILPNLGPNSFKKSYRMKVETFKDFFHIIEPQMKPCLPRKQGATQNGPITNEARLMMALRFMAGGDKHDIGLVHGVHTNEVYRSLWRVVDAIHGTRPLDIKFPEEWETQQSIAKGFEDKSKCGFGNCAGCIDGMLVWINKPVEDSAEMGISSGKFFCGRKKKFGVNLQAVCDHKRRFLDVYCKHPGSCSDFTMWLECELRKQVEMPGFLKSGLVIYGDNAHVNTPCMVTPFKAVNSGGKDDYNFYHSQLRINIECCFGMLVHRFGCLRKPMPTNFTIAKISSLVLALCKLHNFLIDARDETPKAVEKDTFNISMSGGMQLQGVDDSDNGSNFWTYNAERDRVDGLLDGGDYVEQGHHELRRPAGRRRQDLPIHKMLNCIESNGYKRPKPN